jgi:outer membrane receptor protein involved in Fe transport
MLEPEEAVKVELGGEYTPRPGLAFRSALSRDQYRNLIDDSRGTFRNVWKARVEGVECGLTWQLHRSGTALDVNYTSTDAWDERSGRPLPFIPKHRVDASLSGRARWGGGVYLGAQWVGQRAQEVGSPLDGYFVARSRISYRWKHLSAALIVDNVLDEDYSTEEAEYPMPGRTIQLELAVQTGRAGVLEPGTP